MTSLPDDLALSIKNQSIFYRSLNGGVPAVATRSPIVCVCTFSFSSFCNFFNSVFKHVNIYTRRTHKYRVNMFKLYNGVKKFSKDKDI